MGIKESRQQLADEIQLCRDGRASVDSVDLTIKTIMYESILVRAFRALENFFEATFIDYATDEASLSGNTVVTFIRPTDRNHVRRMLIGSGNNRYLDWTNPAVMRSRCEIFLGAPNPLVETLQNFNEQIQWIHKIRNHVAHNSPESAIGFRSVAERFYPTSDPGIHTPGELLLSRPSHGPARQREVLSYLLELIDECADRACEVP